MSKYNLSYRFRDYDNRVFLEMKPYRFKNYTHVIDWNKDNSLLMIIHITENLITIDNTIKYFDEGDKWV